MPRRDKGPQLSQKTKRGSVDSENKVFPLSRTTLKYEKGVVVDKGRRFVHGESFRRRQEDRTGVRRSTCGPLRTPPPERLSTLEENVDSKVLKI